MLQKPTSPDTLKLGEKVRNDPKLPESTIAEYMQQFYRSLRSLTHEHITIYTDAQTAIRRVGSDKSGPG